MDEFIFCIIMGGVIGLVAGIMNAKNKNGEITKKEIAAKNANGVSEEKTKEIKEDNSIRKIKDDTKFAFFDDAERYLRYSYYDIVLDETDVLDFDISKIEAKHQLYFDTEPTNKKDPQAIKVLYDDKLIGYIPPKQMGYMSDGDLRKMMLSYSDGVKRQVCGMTTYVNEKTREIKIGLGFYDTPNKNNLEVLDVKLVGTTSNENYADRQLNLSFCSVGEKVELGYDYDKERYIVSDIVEIGEIDKRTSEKIRAFEDENLDIKAGLIEKETDENGNEQAKIRILVR